MVPGTAPDRLPKEAIMAKAIAITLDGHTPVPASPAEPGSEPWLAVYLRKSNDPKRTFLAVERQREDSEELAAMRLPQVPRDRYRIYQDNDVTAYDEFEGREWARALYGQGRAKERKEFNRMLADLGAEGATCRGVVTAWSDRMFRSILDLEKFINLTDGMLGPAVPLFSVNSGDIDLSTADGRRRARQDAAQARSEVEKAIERGRREKRARRARGAAFGTRYPHFGYSRAKVDVTVEQYGQERVVKDSTFTIEDDEAGAIRDGAAAFLGGDSWHSIALDWNARGLRGRGGKPFNGASVAKILTSITLAGKLQPVRSDPQQRDGNWPPILDEETVKAIRQKQSDRELAAGAEVDGRKVRRDRPGPKPKYLLTGFLQCGVCGSRRVHVGGPAHRRVYMCLGAWIDKVGQLPPGVKKHHLGRMASGVDAYVTGLVLDKLGRQAAADMLTDRGEDLAQLRAGVEKAVSLKEAHFQDYRKGITEGAEYARLRALDTAAVEEARGKLARALGPVRKVSKFAGMNQAEIEREWDEASIEERRAYVAELAEYFVLKPAGGRGRPKGSGVGMRRGQGGYFKDPINTVIPHWWEPDGSRHGGQADGGGDLPPAGADGSDPG
jgi:DNA invertase Pin-like site-specific DNA recombinase